MIYGLKVLYDILRLINMTLISDVLILRRQILNAEVDNRELDSQEHLRAVTSH